MSTTQEMIGWLSDKLVYDPTAELDRMSRQLRSADPVARLDAVRQLTYMKAADAVALLIAALRDASGEVRAAAARGLAYKGATEAVTSVAVLLADDDSEVRARAVDALDEIGVPRAPSWYRFWRDRIVDAETVRDARVPDLIGRALLDEAAAVRAAALACLPRHGAPGIGTVRDYLDTHPGADAEEREAPQAELARALEAPRPGHRQAAVEALCRIYGESASASLVHALEDSSPEVRRAAVQAVTSVDPRAALPELLERLLDDYDIVVVEAVEGLVRARGRGLFTPADENRIHAGLLEAARRRAARGQPAAARALGELGRVESVTTLCELLHEPSETVAVAAAEALGRINDARSVKPLLALLESSVASSDTVCAAAAALARSSDVRAVPALFRLLFVDARRAVARAVEAALDELCAGLDPALREQLARGDTDARLAAIRRTVSEPRAVMALLRLAVDEHDALRRAALEALVAQGHDVTTLAREALIRGDLPEERRQLARDLVAALQSSSRPRAA